MLSGPSFLHLRDRAFEYVAEHGAVDEPALLAHVFGGTPPYALRSQLLAPLVEDPRLVRGADGAWTVAAAPRAPLTAPAFTALAVATTGADPLRARLVRIAALHVADGAVVERFDVTVNPGVRVPRYAAGRAGLSREVLDEYPAFDLSRLDALVQFLGARPIAAQEAGHAWRFLNSEARRLGRTLPDPTVVDVNALAGAVLETADKPSLNLIARHFDVGFTRSDQPDEEARVLSLVVPRLLEAARARGLTDVQAPVSDGRTPLRSVATARALPASPGVYVLRDDQEAALYVGKARRLRERLTAYVQRPLGATRRLEGLAAAVQRIDTVDCASDLEALVLEDRAIRHLQPRFNTQLRMRAPRTWLRLPPPPPVRAGKRQPALQRLERVVEPSGPGEHLGPFRNDRLTHHARDLARAVFDLDYLRRMRSEAYGEHLQHAWAFLGGDTSEALERTREHHARAIAARDQTGAQRWRGILSAVRDYVPDLLPADPRGARFAVLRPADDALEGFLIERGILRGWAVLDRGTLPALLEQAAPRTTEDDVDVVLHWLGGVRPPGRLVHLPADEDLARRLLAEAADNVLAEVAPCS